MEEKKVQTVEIAQETLDKLKRDNQQLLAANQQLNFQCARMQQALTDKRYDYFFKVLENQMLFPEDYIVKVVKEISAVFVPEEIEKPESEPEEVESN